MNKEFKILEDGNMEVTDEKGIVTKRYYGNSIQKELLSENKSELIEEKLNKEKKQLEENKKVIDLSKWMLILNPILLTTAVVGSFITGGLINPGNFLVGALYHAVYVGGITTLVTATSSIYWATLRKVYKNKIKKNETKISSINIIKNNYEKENKQIKEEDYVRKGFYPNHTFSLETDTQKINESLDKEINMIYECNKGYTPTLKLKRK
jgi:hypothetical protein